MKTVVILSFHYYPSAFVASHRIAKFAKYLPQYGWCPRVVCVDWNNNRYDMYDPSLLSDPVKATILRTLPAKKCLHGGRPSFLCKSAFGVSHPRIALQMLLSRYSPKHLYTYPAGYFVEATSFLRKYIKKNPVDCILATCPERATLAVADKIHKESGIPWIADFRDTYDICTQVKSGKQRQALLDQEPKVLASSSAILTVSEALQHSLQVRHGRPVLVLNNGFDPEDYIMIEPRKPERFTVLYTGSIYFPHQDPRPLFSAVANHLENGRIDPEHFSIEFFSKQEAVLNSLISHYSGIERIVRINPVVPHRECVALQKGSHVLLHLTLGSEKGVLTAKLFEYLAAKRPILCIPGDRDCVEQTLHSTRAGVVCRDEKDIIRQLVCWYKEWQEHGTVFYHGIDHEISKYSCVKQADTLAGILNRCIRGK